MKDLKAEHLLVSDAVMFIGAEPSAHHLPMDAKLSSPESVPAWHTTFGSRHQTGNGNLYIVLKSKYTELTLLVGDLIAWLKPARVCGLTNTHRGLVSQERCLIS